MPPAPASTFTVTNLDVAMARSWTLSAVGPVDHGGTERISGILRGMATLGPDRRIGLVPDSTTARWEFDPARLEEGGVHRRRSRRSGGDDAAALRGARSVVADLGGG